MIRGLLVVSLAILLGACGGGSTGVVGGTTTSSTSSTTATSRASSTTATSSVSSTTATSSSSNSSSPSGTASTGAIRLSWTAPVARADGTPLSLSEIAGYRVHYGTSSGKYTSHVNITNGSLQSATVSGIPIGTYYVAMSTYDASGLESRYSAPVVKSAL
ncbi:MAG: fibronectin type III domain-containing protein [Gammaproteobacteria bacterium]